RDHGRRRRLADRFAAPAAGSCARCCVSRSWAELLGDDETGADAGAAEEGAGLFSRLRDSLGKSRRALTEEIAVAAFDPGDTASWERLEEALIAADVGVPATAELVQRLEARGDAANLGPALQEAH